jgi:peptide/nickel transport system permease protein
VTAKVAPNSALAILVVLHGIVLMAGFLAPYPFADQHRDFPYAPPSRIHFFDTAGHFHPRPFVYGLSPDSRSYPVEFCVGGRLFGVREPGVLFVLGSDGYGRDLFSRLLYGGQVSLLTGLVAAFLSLGIGLILGMVAGFYGGWVDQLLMRSGELFLALPWLYLLLAVRAFLPLHITPVEAFFLLILVIGGIGWVRPARLVRGVVLSGKERAFVLAARGFGASDAYLIGRHIFPLTRGVVLTQATVLIPQFILAEVTLSFLGLGVGEPIPSWGNMLAEARQYYTVVSHPWMLAPGLAVIPVLFAWLLLADALHR